MDRHVLNNTLDLISTHQSNDIYVTEIISTCLTDLLLVATHLRSLVTTIPRQPRSITLYKKVDQGAFQEDIRKTLSMDNPEEMQNPFSENL